MPLFKCIDSHPQSFVLLACWSLKKFQNIENWTLFWQSNPWTHLTTVSKICLCKTYKDSSIHVHADFNPYSNTVTLLNTLIQTNCRHIAVFGGLRELEKLTRFTAIHNDRKECNLASKCCDRQLVWSILWLLVNPCPRHSRQHMKVDIPHIKVIYFAYHSRMYESI